MPQLLRSLPSQGLCIGYGRGLGVTQRGRECDLIPSPQKLWHPDPVSAPPQTQCHPLPAIHEFRTGFPPPPKPLTMALCSHSASVGRLPLPTAFFISSVPCVAASPGLAQHLTSCRAGPSCACSASVSPPTAAESLGLLPVCTCEPSWHCPHLTGPCPPPSGILGSILHTVPGLLPA